MRHYDFFMSIFKLLLFCPIAYVSKTTTRIPQKPVSGFHTFKHNTTNNITTKHINEHMQCLWGVGISDCFSLLKQIYMTEKNICDIMNIKFFYWDSNLIYYCGIKCFLISVISL